MLLPTAASLLPLLALAHAADKAEKDPGKTYTEKELRPHTGDDGPSILLAVNHTVYNVSGSPRFYGPGGPYHHFTGRDASRAWVTECWDSEDQLTWRMDGIEEMFMPRYLDELLDDLAKGKEAPGLSDVMGGAGREQMKALAKTSIEKIGSVTDKERKKRRAEDTPEALKAVEAALKHWIDFFESKYPAVGRVEYGKMPTPPAICEKALKKQPIKGGKLEHMMKGVGKNMAGKGAKVGAGLPELQRKKEGRDEL